MVAEPPSLHAVSSRGRCKRGLPPPTGGGLGDLPWEILEFFKVLGYILGHFWPIWLSALAPLNKAFAA